MTEPTNQDLLNPQGEPNNQQPAGFNIPEEYANHPALQGIHDMDGLLKKVVNQEALIGKKYIGIPDEKSSPEEINRFREAFGVPVDYKDYSIEASPEIKQLYGEDDQKVLDEFKQLMHSAGLSQNQAQQVRTGYDKIVSGIVEQRKAEQAKLDNEFEQMVVTNFGDKKEEKIQIAQDFIQKHVSDNMKPYLPHVLQDNKALIVIADMANNLYPDLKQEDLRNIPGGTPSGISPASVRAKMQDIIASKAFQDKRDLGHEQAVQALQEQAKLLEQISK